MRPLIHQGSEESGRPDSNQVPPAPKGESQRASALVGGDLDISALTDGHLRCVLRHYPNGDCATLLRGTPGGPPTPETRRIGPP